MAVRAMLARAAGLERAHVEPLLRLSRGDITQIVRRRLRGCVRAPPVLYIPGNPRSGGNTIAALDTIYPTQHMALAGRIRAAGALVSRLPPHTPLRKAHFPQRNGLIAASSAATLILEAAAGSGSLSTSRCARSCSRTGFAVPASVNNPLAAGCHTLIRAGTTLVCTPAHVLSGLKIPELNEALVQAPRLHGARPALDKEYEMLLDAVGFEAAGVDVRAARTEFAGEAITSMLLIPELEGRIAPHPGGRYGRIP